MGSLVIETAQVLARTQHGVVSRMQLIDAGRPGTTIQGRIKGGYLFPVFRGVYSVGTQSLSNEGLHAAAVLAVGRGAALGGRSAAMAWGFLEHISPLDVYRLLGGSNQRATLRVTGSLVWPALLVHRPVRLPRRDVVEKNGIPVTSVERTLWDLAGLVPRNRFDRAFNEADRLGLIDGDRLLTLTSEGRGHLGSRSFRARAHARVPDIARAKSVLEGIYLDLRRRHSIPEAEVNAQLLGMEVDLVWQGRRVAVELDGYEFHRGREAFERDAYRGNRLRAEGWSVLRVTWRMLQNEPQEVAALIVGVLNQQPIGVSTK